MVRFLGLKSAVMADRNNKNDSICAFFFSECSPAQKPRGYHIAASTVMGMLQSFTVQNVLPCFAVVAMKENIVEMNGKLSMGN